MVWIWEIRRLMGRAKNNLTRKTKEYHFLLNNAYSFIVAMVFKGKCGATKATKKTRRKTFYGKPQKRGTQKLVLCCYCFYF